MSPKEAASPMIGSKVRKSGFGCKDSASIVVAKKTTIALQLLVYGYLVFPLLSSGDCCVADAYSILSQNFTILASFVLKKQVRKKRSQEVIVLGRQWPGSGQEWGAISWEERSLLRGEVARLLPPGPRRVLTSCLNPDKWTFL